MGDMVVADLANVFSKTLKVTLYRAKMYLYGALCSSFHASLNVFTIKPNLHMLETLKSACPYESRGD